MKYEADMYHRINKLTVFTAYEADKCFRINTFLEKYEADMPFIFNKMENNRQEWDMLNISPGTGNGSWASA